MLAIIIPYYKLAFFEATLQSLVAQTCQDFKVYIGDDASPEDPKVLLEQFQGKFDFLYHRFEENLGSTSLTQQWERCIALSDNEPWLMILGDDDVLGENVVEEFYRNLPEIEEIGCNVVRFATQKLNEFGECISEIYLHPKVEKASDFFLRKTRSSLSEYIFRKVNVVKIGFRDFALGWYSDVMAVLEFSDFSGTACPTSQCSTIFPSCTRKMSTNAWPRSLGSAGLSMQWLCIATRSFSAMVRLRVQRKVPFSTYLAKPLIKVSRPSLPSGLC